MANIKSAKKRINQSERARQRNMAVKSRVKTFVKQASAAIEAKDAEKVRSILPTALTEIDRAASRGVIHRHSAARKKSALQSRAAALLR